jgi:hypothetical protein
VNPKLQPHKLLLVFVLLFAILSLATNEGSIDIHLHDTFYIISRKDWFSGIALSLSFSGLLTLLIQKLQVSIIPVWLYAVITILSLSALTGVSVNYEYNSTALEVIRFVQESSILSFILAQVILIVILIIGTFKTFRKKSI